MRERRVLQSLQTRQRGRGGEGCCTLVGGRETGIGVVVKAEVEEDESRRTTLLTRESIKDDWQRGRDRHKLVRHCSDQSVLLCSLSLSIITTCVFDIFKKIFCYKTTLHLGFPSLRST